MTRTRLPLIYRLLLLAVATVICSMPAVAQTSCPTITVGPVEIPDGKLHQEYSQLITVSGGTGPYTLTVTSGSLPASIIIRSSRLTGIADVEGVFTFTITAKDAFGCTGSKTFTLTIKGEPPPCPVITIGPSPLPAAVIGVPYSAKVTAYGGTSPYEYSSRGNLPPGLNLINNVVSGTASALGQFNFEIVALDSKNCTGSQAYQFFVIDKQCPVDVAVVASPANEATIDGSKGVTFSWSAVTGATSYDVLVSTDSGATFNTAASTPDAATTSVTSNLSNGSYLFVVRTNFSGSCSTRSIGTKIKVVNAPCTSAPAALTAPVNLSTVTSPVTFQWNGTPGATFKLFTSSNGGSFELSALTAEMSTTRIMPAGVIEWYIQTNIAGCPATKSVTGRFTVAQTSCGAGSNLNLTSPPNGATVASPATFAWSPVAGASAYRLWLSIDGSNPIAVLRTADTSVNIPVPSGAVDWFVEAILEKCPSIFSPHAKFTVQAASTCGTPQAPTLVSPLGSAAAPAQVTNPVTFVWNAVPNAILYRVSVSSDSLTYVEIGTTKETQLTTPVAEGVFWWRVDALFSGCPAATSTSGVIRVTDVTTCGGGSPNAVAPANNSTTVTSPVTFSWTGPAGAAAYRLLASYNGGELVLLGTTTATTLTRTIPAGSVAWLVEAVFPGCASTRSGVSRFTVPRTAGCPAEKSQLVYPLNGDGNVTTPVTFDWTAVNGANRYVLVARGANGAPTILGETPLTQMQRDVPQGTVEWWVVALGGGCDPIPSDHATFQVPAATGCSNRRPKVLTPVDDSTNLTSPVTFSWTPVPGAKGYRVFASLNAGDPSNVASTSSTQVSVPMPTGAIRWTVAAVFDSCPTLYSTVSDLTVAPASGDCGTPKRPAAYSAGQVLSGTTYAVRWTAVDNANTYQVQESTSPLFVNATTTTVSGVAATFSHTAADAPVLYYYRVRAISSCGDTRSGFSRPVATRIIPPALGVRNSATAEVGVDRGIVQTINIPGGTAPVSFTATADKPWVTITPSSGTIPTTGLALTVTSDPAALDVGANRATVKITTVGAKSIVPHATTPSTIPVTVSLVTPVVPQGKNGPQPDSLIIPAVAHGPGANNSLFLSDLRLSNVSAQPMKYQINFTPSGANGTQTGSSTTLQVDPGSTAALNDILTSFFGTAADGSSTGMLEIRPLTSTLNNTFSGIASAPLSIASSRTYNQTALGSFGQFVPAIPFSSFVGQGGVLSLQQIAQSSAYRTNFGLVEGAGEAASVVLHVYDKNGTRLKDINESLQPSEHKPLNALLSQNGVTLDDGRVEVEVTSSTGKVSAYASVLDNGTSDPLLVSPVLKGSVSANRYVIPGVAYTNSSAAWRSDLRLFNSGTSQVTATLTFYPQGSPDKPKSITTSIAPGEVKALDNVLNTAFGINDPSAGGSVVVTTASNSSIVATARTYAQTSLGTIGQFVPAVTPGESVGAGGRTLQLLQLEQSDAFRTNIGLAETTGNPATVEISLIEPDTKITPVLTWPLAANEFVQLPLTTFNTGHAVYNARIAVKVVSGSGKVTAYASVVDNISQDPTYVPAQ